MLAMQSNPTGVSDDRKRGVSIPGGGDSGWVHQDLVSTDNERNGDFGWVHQASTDEERKVQDSAYVGWGEHLLADEHGLPSSPSWVQIDQDREKYSIVERGYLSPREEADWLTAGSEIHQSSSIEIPSPHWVGDASSDIKQVDVLAVIHDHEVEPPPPPPPPPTGRGKSILERIEEAATRATPKERTARIGGKDVANRKRRGSKSNAMSNTARFQNAVEKENQTQGVSQVLCASNSSQGLSCTGGWRATAERLEKSKPKHDLVSSIEAISTPERERDFKATYQARLQEARLRHLSANEGIN